MSYIAQQTYRLQVTSVEGPLGDDHARGCAYSWEAPEQGHSAAVKHGWQGLKRQPHMDWQCLAGSFPQVILACQIASSRAPAPVQGAMTSVGRKVNPRAWSSLLGRQHVRPRPCLCQLVTKPAAQQQPMPAVPGPHEHRHRQGGRMLASRSVQPRARHTEVVLSRSGWWKEEAAAAHVLVTRLQL